MITYRLSRIADNLQSPRATAIWFQQRRSGATNFYLADVLGSTDRLLNASQTTLNRYIYSAFGTDVSTTGSTTNLYRWLGGLGYSTPAFITTGTGI